MISKWDRINDSTAYMKSLAAWDDVYSTINVVLCGANIFGGPALGHTSYFITGWMYWVRPYSTVVRVTYYLSEPSWIIKFQCNRTNTFIQLWRWRQQRSYPFLKKLPPWLHAPENPRKPPVPAHLRVSYSHLISDSAPCFDTVTRLRSQFKWELLFTAKRFVERINMRWRCP